MEVQLHSKMVIDLEVCTLKSSEMLRFSCGRNNFWQRIFTRESFLFIVRIVSFVKRSAIGSRKNSERRSNVADKERSGRPDQIATEETVYMVEEMIKAD